MRSRVREAPRQAIRASGMPYSAWSIAINVLLAAVANRPVDRMDGRLVDECAETLATVDALKVVPGVGVDLR